MPVWSPRQRSVSFVGFLLVVAAAGVGSMGAQEPRPLFRSGTELIAVDVQVVSGKGLPVLGLGPDKFEVTINGRPRRVVSAELVTYDSARVTAEQPSTNTPLSRANRSGVVLPRRLYMLALDERSFLPGYASGALEAARGFVGKLQPSDLLGFVSYPSGAVISPTTDRAPVLAALKRIAGLRQLPVTRFNLRVSDVVSISRHILEFHTLSVNVLEIGQRHPELSPILNKVCPPTDPDVGLCYKLVAEEVENLFLHFESEASMSFGVIRGVLGDLARIDGRKTLVLLSGGVVVSDQAGGRPDLGNLSILMAQEAARANVGIYTLFVDWKFLEQFSASQRLPALLTNLSRDTSINGHWLSEFSKTAGGEMLTISAGSGDFAFNRILSESSAFYLVGVAPEPGDRDGRPRRLGVKVKQRGITVRARSWVAVDNEVLASATPMPVDDDDLPSALAPAAPTPPAPPAAPPPAATTAAASPVPVPALPPARPATVEPPRPALPVRPPASAVADSPALPFVLTNAGAYVTRLNTVFSNVVAEERYEQTTEAGASNRPAVPRRVSVSDFLLITLPGGSTREWFRDTFEVNGSPIRDRQQRLVDIFTKPDATSVARAAEILKESAVYNIGIERNINLPTLGLEVLRPDMQRRFSFSGGAIDRSLAAPAYLIAFTETAHPSVIKGTSGADLLMQGRVWVDVKTGFVVKTELALDDAGFSGTISMIYRADPTFGLGIPVEMSEDYTEADGRRTKATATYGRFRRFGVETRDEIAQPQ